MPRLRAVQIAKPVTGRRGFRMTIFGTVAACLVFGATGVVFAETVPPTEIPDADRVFFDEKVQPILKSRCAKCHWSDAENLRGGLDLADRAGWQSGGDNGPAIVPGEPDESLLIQAVRGDGDVPAMPPKSAGGRLSDNEISILEDWVRRGAIDPRDASESPPSKPTTATWWSLQPLAETILVPAVDASFTDASFTNVAMNKAPISDIDRFVFARLIAAGLSPAPLADRATLIRRVSFDLTGLPPSFEETAAFVSDPSADAYERLVDRLLASPRYGERWGRHWLDVVHYGETHGYDKDQPRPNAWQYRDYVIRSFNADKPVEQFIQEQVAGDVLWPDTLDGHTAVGFLAAGPWDLIGHAELPESKTDGAIARMLDRDDMVANVMNTFCGLTLQCARCHHHKFDPVSQLDYYRSTAIVAAVDRADRRFDTSPTAGSMRRELLAKQQELRDSEADLLVQIRSAGGPEYARIEAELAKNRNGRSTDRAPEYGWHSAIEATQNVEKWVQVDLGAPQNLDRIELFACDDDFAGIGAGFGFPVRFRIEISDDETFSASPVVKIFDETGRDVPNPGIKPLSFSVAGHTARYVRVTATKLAHRSGDFICAISELRVLNSDNKNLAAAAAVSAIDSIEAAPRWRKSNLVDGIAPGLAATPVDISTLEQQLAAIVKERVPGELLNQRNTLLQKLAATSSDLEALPPQHVAFVATVHNGTGAFAGTGANGGKPRAIHVLQRGDIRQPGRAVEPGVPLLFGESGEFTIAEDRPEGERRVLLARWLTDRRHPLTWRVLANRVWQYHFGTGIVSTPNDFGRMGQFPSHPELLDWLAARLRSTGSIKDLHRQILMSRTYQQMSTVADDVAETASAIDGDNRLLWRQNRRKLEAEAIRDTVLLLAGKLREGRAGPGFRDFVIEKPEHSPHYRYDLADVNDPAIHRRSVYRMLVRSQPQPFMSALDCADPSQSVDRRNQSQSPLQAMALLNDRLMLVMANETAARILSLEQSPTEQVSRLFRESFGRLPTIEEQAELMKLRNSHGLAAVCRVIFNLNEFCYVD